MDSSLPYQLNNKGNLPFLRELASNKDSYVRKVSQTIHVGLLPSILGRLRTGIQDALNNKLRKYDPELDGILVGYDNIALVGNDGHMVPGYHHIHVNVKADFYVFNPKVGGTLTGTVLKKSGASATCLANKVFTVFVSFPPHLKHSIQLHQEISFTIDKVDLFSQIPFVKGTLDESCVSSATSESHRRFGDGGAPPRADADSGLSSIDDDVSAGPSPGPSAAVDETDARQPRKSPKKRKRQDAEDRADAGAEGTPRKKRAKRESELFVKAEVPPEDERGPEVSEMASPDPPPPDDHERRRSGKKKRDRSVADGVLQTGSPSGEKQELYLPDLITPNGRERRRSAKRKTADAAPGGLAS